LILPLFLSAITLIAGSILILSDPASSFGLKTAMAPPAAFGHFLFQKYWLSVEIISLLLFVSLAGALFLGKKPEKIIKPNDLNLHSNKLTDQQSEKSEDTP
jgi:NADH-quinone oxidoreductase subunit J